MSRILAGADARSILAFTFAPERAWQEAAGQSVSYPVARHLGALALIPATVAALLVATQSTLVPAAWLTPLAPDSPFALALPGGLPALAVPLTPLAARGTPAAAAAAFLLAYGATWLVVASGAVILNLLLPLFSARRDLHRCMMVASYAATPVLLSSAALLVPSFVAVIALALMHACYVAYLGLPVMLGVPRGEAGMCLGIATIAALVFGQVAGYCAGTLISVAGY